MLADPDRVLLRGMEIDTRQSEPPIAAGLRIEGYAPGERGYYIVQFAGPVVRAWTDEVRRLGGELLDYLPNNAFVVRMDGATRGQVSAAGFVRWVGIFQPAYKVDSEIGRRTFQNPSRGTPGPRQLVVELFALEDPAAVVPAVAALGAQVTCVIDEPDIKRLELQADAALVGPIARLNAVRWIEELGEINLRNNVTRLGSRTS